MDVAAIFGALALAGLAGSLHCLGMCGPLLVAFSQALGPGGRRRDLLAYHAGRVWTYGVLGFFAGWAGFELRAGAAGLGWQRPLGVVLAALVVIAGLGLLGWVPGLALDAGCVVRLARRRGVPGALLRHSSPLARLLLGALMGLLPCGLVYAALVVAATLPTPLHAAFGMLVFGAGTLPALSALFAARRLVPQRLRAHGTPLAAGLLIAAGVVMLARALSASPPAAGSL